ncbi:DNA sulfur modification protein DndD [Clostridiales bacterium FE2011]|nr:DNA sulfur modification protein DndD [Clostridiales bacterium FE2011]
MIIRKVELRNFGLYYGHHEIDFTVGDQEKNVTLIGGLNGRGKTTFLDSITLGLYGRRALRYLQDERIKYSQYLLNHINKSALHDETMVRITLGDVSVEDNELVISRRWSQDRKGAVQEIFEVFRHGVLDATLSENWDYYVEEILPLNISRFFFFDNEKIAQIADDETFESVKESIQSLLGLTTIDSLTEDMQKYISLAYEQDKKTPENETEQELKKIELDLSEIRRENERLSVDLSDLKGELRTTEEQYASLESEFWAKGGNLGLKKEEMEQRRDSLNNDLNLKQSQVTGLVESSMTPFLVCRRLLMDAYDSASRAEKEKASAYMDKTLDILAERLKQGSYGAEEIKTISIFLQQMKDQMMQNPQPEQTDALSASSYLLLSNLVLHLEEEVRKIDLLEDEIESIRNELDSLEMMLSFEASETDVRETWNKMQKLSSEKLEKEVRRKSVEEEIERNEGRIANLEKNRERLHQKQLASGQVRDQNQRMIEYAGKTIKVMEAFRKKIQINRTRELEENVYRCFTFMMQKQGMIQGIQIDPNTLDIHLIDYNNKELRKDQLSAGEKQLFAISIIWGLAQSSGYDMPVIVDTPLGRLDSNHRTNFVERYLPNAGKQVIVLSTDEEVNGRYYDMLKEDIRAVFTLVYNEETRSTSIHKGYFGGIEG